MIDKLAGLATQIRDLERRLKEIDTKKANPSKVKEITDTIKNLKDMLEEKKQKKEERRKKKEEASKPAEAPKAEATIQPTEVVKESLTTPTEVTKESTVEKFAIDSKVEPIRGTPGSYGTVIREAGVNGDPLVYVRWNEGHLKEAHGEYGAYYPSDLRLKAEVAVEAKDPTAYVPREQLYNLEADLKSNYERMISDLQEEIKTAQEKGEYAWVGRLEEKLTDIQKAYKEKFEKTAEENGSGGTDKLNVVDLNPPYDKDPQEKATGYGGDRPMGAMTAPNNDDNSLPLESTLKTADEHEDETRFERAVDRLDKRLMNHEIHQEEYDKLMKELKKEHFPKEAFLKTAAEYGTHGNNVGLNDLYVLPASPEEVAKIEAYLKQNGRSYEWSMANVKGHGWFGKRFIDIPFGESLKPEIEKLQAEPNLETHAYLKFADLDLNSIEKRWALYVDGKLAIRTLTYSKAERIAKERFPEQVAAGKYEIKREDHVPVEASLDKQAINVTIAEKLFVVNPMGKTAENEYGYDVNLADGSKLFKITSKDEMGQEHLAYVIEKELMNHKDAAKKKSSLAKLTSNLAFLKKGTFVSILDVDNNKKQVKFASLDNSLRGWAPMQKFAAMEVPEANLIDHEGHKDELLAENGREILVLCPTGSVNVEWRTVKAPPATPESLNPDVASLKEARGCDQCNAAMINGVFCHEMGCPNARKHREQEEEFDIESNKKADYTGDTEPPMSGAENMEYYCPLCKNVFEEYDVNQHKGCPGKLEVVDENTVIPTMTQEEHYQEWLKEHPDKYASLNKDAHIRHEDGKWVIYSHDYKKKLGTYDTEAEATKRLKQIEYFKHQGSLQPLSKKEAAWPLCSVEGCNNKADSVGTDDSKRYCYTHSWGHKQKMKEANVMETKCEECGKELGPEVFLSKWPVCGKCTKKRHEKALGKHKKADQEISLEQQVQGFKDRMNAVTERLSNPPAKTADLETTQDLTNVDVKDLSEGILHMIDLLESKIGMNVSADPELHPMLEDLENKVFEIEIKLGIKPTLSEEEKLEPEHKQFVEEDVEKESSVEVKADDVNTPPTQLPPQGMKWAWSPKNNQWIMVAIGSTGF